MDLDGPREAKHGAVDMMVLLAIVCLALVTWAYLSEAASVPLWQLYVSVAIPWLLALAALTRHSHWSASIRFLAGGWIIAAPHLFNFIGITPAYWTYLAIGMIMVASSIPGLATVRAGRIRTAV